VNWGGALSGRDIEAVNKTISGLVKLLYPDPKVEVPDDALEQIVKLALEVRRRVKEQQKRIFKTEFRNSHLSYFMGIEGVEQFVATPELHSDDSIDTDPLPPGQVWAISPGSGESPAGLYRIEINCGPGSGVKILNNPKPAAFSESVRYAEQNLYNRAKELVGDRDARSHEFSVQLRAMDADKSGSSLGLPVLVALVSSLLERNSKGGVILAGALNLGGSVEMIANPVALAELAYEKGATTLLLPVSARKQLLSLSDEIATKLNIEFYSESVDAVFKALEQ
jgi:ATP-dependent Lon protease